MFRFSFGAMVISLLGTGTTGMLIGSAQSARAADATAPGATQVARWKDNKPGALLLEFDDGCASHLSNVIPELKKRGFVGTFYVNPGKGLYTQAWENEVPATGVAEYGNHTYRHVGLANPAELDEDLKLCNAAIARAFPDRKLPRLISYGQPGVPDYKETWLVSEDDLQVVLARLNLIHRGPFMGAASVYNGIDQYKGVVDKAIADGSAESICFHGVGGDWISVPMTEFIPLLDYMVSKQDRLWVTDHISSHKYETERDGAEVTVVAATDTQIRLTLTSRIRPKLLGVNGQSYSNDKADPALYDAPLTLITQVPAGWARCEIAQGAQRKVVAAANGTVQYDALPNGEPITIQPATP
jgi:hypothetical protein